MLGHAEITVKTVPGPLDGSLSFSSELHFVNGSVPLSVTHVNSARAVWSIDPLFQICRAKTNCF